MSRLCSQYTRRVLLVVTFFDLIILHQQLPAFDYSATFDPMSAQINEVGGERIIQDVHVQGVVYDPIRDAVVAQLQDRMATGPFVPAEVARQIPAYLAALGYQWAPNIGTIEPALADVQSRIVARFLVGHLLFAGYAQMSGLPHVLSPRRGRLMAAAGLPIGWGVPAAEAAVWQTVGERLAGRCWACHKCQRGMAARLFVSPYSRQVSSSRAIVLVPPGVCCQGMGGVSDG